MNDLISRQTGKMKLCKECEYFHIRCEYKNPYEWGEAVCEKHNLITDFRSKKKFEAFYCVENDTQKGGQGMNDPISRQAAVDAVKRLSLGETDATRLAMRIGDYLERLQSAQQEPLTDKEQRIFLAAMDREMKVCEEIDRNYVREPYEDSLVSVCKEIKRKVKGALWTI